MRHIIYKTTHTNGKYYIGRHSTENIDDGYLGSGKWVSQIKDKRTLSREILTEVKTPSELMDAEQKYLDQYYDDDNCMNMMKSNLGFTTEYNPMKDPQVVSKISGENHWLAKDPERKQEISTRQKRRVEAGLHNLVGATNPMNKHRNREKMSKLTTKRNKENNPSTKLAAEGKHHWQNGKAPNANGEQNKRLIAEGRHNFQGPEHNRKMIAEGKNPWVGPAGNLKRLAAGNHPSQIKMTCEHCGKVASKGMIVRWHGDNCRTQKNK